MRLIPMNRIVALVGLIAAGFAACSDDDNPVDPGNGNGNGSIVAILQGQVRESRTLSADSIYVVRGFVEVFPGGTLTIPAGTELVSEIGTDGSIVTLRGDDANPSGRLVVEGTAGNPVIFRPGTVQDAEAGLTPAQVASCSRNSAGGIVLHGRAPVNQPGGVVSEGIGRAFGGDDPTDDSGDIQFLVILCAGTEIAPDNEINGLTLAGTGNGTRISHVQVHLGGDDGFEWFGGTTNADHLIVSGEDDDAFDCDFGWTGTVQFGLVVQDADVANRGMECDNDGDGSSLTPLTAPTFWNITWIGTRVDIANSEVNDGLFLRRNSSPDIYNSIVANFGNVGATIDGSGSQGQAATGALDLDNILFFDNGGSAGVPPVTRPWSRIVELHPLTQREVWSYHCSPGGELQCTGGAPAAFFSPYMGSAQRLPNGNTLITESTGGRVFEVTSVGELVWEYVTGGRTVYRAYRWPFRWRGAEISPFFW